jgi:nitroreductase
MSIMDTIEKRKSIRTYTTKKVEHDKISAIITAGNCAPSFGTFHMTVIQNQEFLIDISNRTIEMMKTSGNELLAQTASASGYNPIYGATVMIVFSAKNGKDKLGYNMANIACAAENMMLVATELGIGSCFVMAPMIVFYNAEMLNKLNVEQGYLPLASVLIGYTDETLEHETRIEKGNVNYVN